MSEHRKLKDGITYIERMDVEWLWTKEAVGPCFFGTVIYVVNGKLARHSQDVVYVAHVLLDP